MHLITRDAATDYMNYIQFADECWLQGLDYAFYAASAKQCGKIVMTEQQYQSHCEFNEAQAQAYLKG